MKSATFGHDGRIRDYQRRTAQWTGGKNFDGTGALGRGRWRAPTCRPARWA
jgi:2-keto-4-pentenoate hydratase/2-oxohepta-3-ene-1,7-dioic acid hydratase in catechol pathway